MNQEQLLSIVRAVLQIVGTGLVSKGVIGAADWTTIAGGVLMIAPVIWGLIAHTEAAQIANVAKMAADPASPVKGVVVEQSVEGRRLIDTVGSVDVVPAGTATAATMAKQS